MLICTEISKSCKISTGTKKAQLYVRYVLLFSQINDHFLPTSGPKASYINIYEKGRVCQGKCQFILFNVYKFAVVHSRKEAYVHKSVMNELRRIIEDSEVMAEDDALWPQPGKIVSKL